MILRVTIRRVFFHPLGDALRKSFDQVVVKAFDQDKHLAGLLAALDEADRGISGYHATTIAIEREWLPGLAVAFKVLSRAGAGVQHDTDYARKLYERLVVELRRSPVDLLADLDREHERVI